MASLEQTVVNTIRGLAIDGVEKAKSGHPGLPMGMADAAFVLWTRFLRHDPGAPSWPGRDRFVLSAGHGSMLLYAMLHLSGYDLSLDALKSFRQWESPTPGHPEYGCAPGVETTTGPLGQGFGNAVGMAIAARILAGRFNAPDFPIIEGRIYAIVSDGDLMEGVASEAASLAGHLGLGNIVLLYDDNHVTIEGDTSLAFSEDVPKRFEACNWHVVIVQDGHDREAIARGIEAGRAETGRPSLVVLRTKIGFGAPTKEGKAAAHGEPLGAEEAKGAKRNLGLSEDETFVVPDEVRAFFAKLRQGWRNRREDWEALLARYRKAHPDKAAEWDAWFSGDPPADIESALPEFEAGKGVATRASAGQVLNAIASRVPQLVGGSADLAPSTKTLLKGIPAIGPGAFDGRNFHFGIREHGMGAILNGLALSGALIPYGATFLVFADYMRPPIRLAAMMGLRVIYVFTHDSIFVGEDGPTHQPIEQVAALRAIPNLNVIRPSDATEAGYAWVAALRRRDGPTALILSRQNVTTLDRTSYPPAAGLLRGGYVVADDAAPLDWVIVATGSEVEVALGAAKILREKGKKIRVVSMPSWEIFDAQDPAYRARILPKGPRYASVEAGVTFGWERYVGRDGVRIGMDRFGASAPYKLLAEKFGFTPQAVAEMLLCG
ncbi:MAG: transketolase [Planctomycetes bacterium]|nr:transketolase [Planctomycetota bacterium]